MKKLKEILNESDKKVEWALKTHTKFDYSHDLPLQDFHKDYEGGEAAYREDPNYKLSDHDKAKMIVDWAAYSDPTRPKYKYMNWTIGQYKKGHIRAEDMLDAADSPVADTLSQFDQLKHHLPPVNTPKGLKPGNDINSYHHIADVRTALKPFLKAEDTSKVIKALSTHPGAKQIHKEDGMIVHRIDTKDAAKSIRYANPNNKWCTYRLEDKSNMFDVYHKKGPLYVVHATDNEGNLEHYQLHFHTGQYADENDKMHNLTDLTTKYPKLKNVKFQL